VNTVTLPLQLVASRMAELVLAAIGLPVFREGNVLVLPMGTLEVAEACSGLRSLVSLSGIALLLAWMSDTAAWKRALLVIGAIPIAVAMNGLRIAATGAAVMRWGPAAAADPWHTAAGWLTFVAATGVLIAMQVRLCGGGKRDTTNV
jgi:exosortase